MHLRVQVTSPTTRMTLRSRATGILGGGASSICTYIWDTFVSANLSCTSSGNYTLDCLSIWVRLMIFRTPHFCGWEWFRILYIKPPDFCLDWRFFAMVRWFVRWFFLQGTTRRFAVVSTVYHVIACDWKKHRFLRVNLMGHLDVVLTCHHTKSLLNHHFFVELKNKKLRFLPPKVADPHYAMIWPINSFCPGARISVKEGTRTTLWGDSERGICEWFHFKTKIYQYRKW